MEATSVKPSAARDAIWIASYPKSGNTWVQSVVRLAGRPFGFPNSDVDVYKMIAEKRQPQTVRGVRPRVSSATSTVLKTHDRFRAGARLHPGLKLDTAAFVYVMRNPLDVLLSYINFTRRQYDNDHLRESAQYQQMLFIDLLGFERPFTVEQWREMTLDSIPRRHLDHALQRFAEQDTLIPSLQATAGGSWLEHCESWLAASKDLPSVLLRYEDILARPEQFLSLRKLFVFTEPQILAAARTVDANLRARQYKSIFFNKMTSYYFREYFSPSLVDCFFSRFESRLRALGYGDLYTSDLNGG